MEPPDEGMMRCIRTWSFSSYNIHLVYVVKPNTLRSSTSDNVDLESWIMNVTYPCRIVIVRKHT